MVHFIPNSPPTSTQWLHTVIATQRSHKHKSTLSPLISLSETCYYSRHIIILFLSRVGPICYVRHTIFQHGPWKARLSRHLHDFNYHHCLSCIRFCRFSPQLCIFHTWRISSLSRLYPVIAIRHNWWRNKNTVYSFALQFHPTFSF